MWSQNSRETTLAKRTITTPLGRPFPSVAFGMLLWFEHHHWENTKFAPVLYNCWIGWEIFFAVLSPIITSETRHEIKRVRIKQYKKSYGIYRLCMTMAFKVVTPYNPSLIFRSVTPLYIQPSSAEKLLPIIVSVACLLFGSFLEESTLVFRCFSLNISDSIWFQRPLSICSCP